ncbi:MAG: baseplate J/gp47 family protein [Clostridia bacterium]|nr:baseplate J/gp47 family protein [Clostridia bacterium]
MVDFRQLLGLKGLETLLQEFFERFRDAGGKATNLNPGGVLRTMAESGLSPVAELNDLLEKVVPQGFAAHATGQWLDLKAQDVGITRLEAKKTKGVVTVTRQDASSSLLIPAGTVMKTGLGPDGGSLRYFVTTDTVLPAGQAQGSVPVEAEFAGAEYNVGEGYITVLETYIPGVDELTNGATWITEEGTDTESDEDLRQRYFLRWNELATGGTDASYISWARAVAGVVDVAVNSQFPRGQGTVDVIITGPEGAPSQELIQQVQDYIDQRRPNVANVLVKGPTTRTVDVAAIIYLPADKGDEAAARLAGEQIVQAYFGIGQVDGVESRQIGDSAYLSRITALLMTVPDAVNAVISSPAGDVIVQPDELTVLGTLTITVQRVA